MIKRFPNHINPPWYYGFAYSSPEYMANTFAIIPFNILISIGRWVWVFQRHRATRWSGRDAIFFMDCRCGKRYRIKTDEKTLYCIIEPLEDE